MNGVAFIVRELSRRPVMFEGGEHKLTPRVQEVADLVRQNPGITMSALALKLGSAKRTVGIHLNVAMHCRLIKCDSRGRYSRWWPV